MQNTLETMDEEEADYLSVDEVREMIRQLNPTDATKISNTARWFSLRCHIPAEDLRQEAFKRLLSGSRQARRGVEFAREMSGAIRSIASAEIETIRNGLREVRPTPDGVAAPDLADPSPSPERLLMSARDDGEVLDAIGQLIEDDEQLQLLLEGICDQMRGDQLEELLGVDTQGLATARRRLKRRLQNAFPKGLES